MYFRADYFNALFYGYLLGIINRKREMAHFAAGKHAATRHLYPYRGEEAKRTNKLC